MASSESTMTAVGPVVRRLRKGAGLTALELAEGLGRWSRSYVSSVENGHVRPSNPFLRACETFFGLEQGSLGSTTASFRVQTVPDLLRTARHLAPIEVTTAPRSRPDHLDTPQQVQAMICWLLARAEGTRVVLATLTEHRGSFGQALPEWLANAIATTLARNCDVEHLLRVDLGHSTANTDVDRMLRLLASPGGSYLPLSVDPAVQCGFDVLHVPGVAILLFNTLQGFLHDDTVDGGSVRLRDFLLAQAQSVRGAATPLFTRYVHDDTAEHVAFYHRRSMIEAQTGPCFTVSDRLSTYARPLKYWERDGARSRRYTGWLDAKRQAVTIFEEDHLEHDYLEVVSRRSLRHFAREGRFAGVAPKRPAAPVADRRLVFEHLLTLLRDPASRYRLRFGDDDDAEGVTRNSWLYKRAHNRAYVLLYAATDQLTMHLEVSHSALSDHFRNQFEAIWLDLENRSSPDDVVTALEECRDLTL